MGERVKWLIAYGINCLVAGLLLTAMASLVLWAHPGRTWYQTMICVIWAIGAMLFGLMWLISAYRVLRGRTNQNIRADGNR